MRIRIWFVNYQKVDPDYDLSDSDCDFKDFRRRTYILSTYTCTIQLMKQVFPRLISPRSPSFEFSENSRIFGLFFNKHSSWNMLFVNCHVSWKIQFISYIIYLKTTIFFDLGQSSERYICFYYAYRESKIFHWEKNTSKCTIYIYVAQFSV